MKTSFTHLKEILHDNKEDLKYLLYVGIPTGIFLILISRYLDYSNLY